MGFADPDPDFFVTNTATALVVWDTRPRYVALAGIPASTTGILIPFELPPNPHALTRPAQLEELARLAMTGRRRQSPREGARFGWQDSPRLPCYRAVRVR